MTTAGSQQDCALCSTAQEFQRLKPQWSSRKFRCVASARVAVEARATLKWDLLLNLWNPVQEAALDVLKEHAAWTSQWETVADQAYKLVKWQAESMAASKLTWQLLACFCLRLYTELVLLNFAELVIRVLYI